MCVYVRFDFFFLFCGFKRFIDGVSTETWDKGFVSALVFLRMETFYKDFSKDCPTNER